MASPGEILAVALPVLVGLALIGLAILVLRNGGRHRHGRLFATLFLASGVKSVGDGLLTSYVRADGAQAFVADSLAASSPLFPTASTWFTVTQVCALVMLPVLFLFCASFPRPATWTRGRFPMVAVAAFLPSALVALLLFTAAPDGTLAPALLAGFDVVDLAVGFNVVAAGMTVTALVLLVRTRHQAPDPIERKQAAFVTLGFVPSFVMTWVLAAALVGYNLGQVPGATLSDVNATVLHFVSPLLEMVAAGLVGVAILRYNILGVSPRFRVGVKSSIVGFVLVLTFLVTQAIESIVLEGQLFAFAGQYGFLLSGVSSVVLFRPIERLSSRLSDRLLPRADAAPLTRAGEVYHAQCTYVLRDGQVSEREMAFLRNLREQLGLTEAQARSIEEKVERLLQVDSPRTGATAATSVGHLAAAHGELASTLARHGDPARGAVQVKPEPAHQATDAGAPSAGQRPEPRPRRGVP